MMEKKFKCEHCGKCFSRKGHLNVHIRIHTGEKPYKCKECGKCFVQNSELKMHLLTHTGEKPFKCLYCQRCFSSKPKLTSHIRTHTGEKPFKCVECGKCFAQSSALRSHSSLHSTEKAFKCELCGKSFRTRGILYGHLKVHNGEKPFRCEQCGKTFTFSSNLKNHARLHSGKKPFVCEQCGKNFAVKHNLNKHLKLHIEEKPFVCEHCDRGFSIRSYLTEHLRTHTGEKPFMCEHCGKCYANRTNFSKHLKRHASEKLLSCKQCDKGFPDNDSLITHLKTHKEKEMLKCEHCEQDFLDIYDLIEHTLTHIQTAPVRFEQCGKGYSNGNSPQVHVKDQTEAELESPKCSSQCNGEIENLEEIGNSVMPVGNSTMQKSLNCRMDCENDIQNNQDAAAQNGNHCGSQKQFDSVKEIENMKTQSKDARVQKILENVLQSNTEIDVKGSNISEDKIILDIQIMKKQKLQEKDGNYNIMMNRRVKDCDLGNESMAAVPTKDTLVQMCKDGDLERPDKITESMMPVIAVAIPQNYQDGIATIEHAGIENVRNIELQSNRDMSEETLKDITSDEDLQNGSDIGMESQENRLLTNIDVELQTDKYRTNERLKDKADPTIQNKRNTAKESEDILRLDKINLRNKHNKPGVKLQDNNSTPQKNKNTASQQHKVNSRCEGLSSRKEQTVGNERITRSQSSKSANKSRQNSKGVALRTKVKTRTQHGKSDCINRKGIRSQKIKRLNKREEPKKIPTKQKRVKSHACGYCGKFFYAGHIAAHIRIHTGEKPFTCEVCGRSFTEKSALRVHTRTHIGVEKLFECELCAKRFARKYDLLEHSRTHTGEKPFKCEICEKCFYSASNLKKHASLHSAEKPFICEKCGQCFALSSYLSKHMRAHSEEKPFKCELCHKCFSTRVGYVEHVRTHTGEKPYTCELCGKSFVSAKALKRHKLVHTGEKPYKCDECGKCYARRYNLKIHEKLHSKEITQHFVPPVEHFVIVTDATLIFEEQ